ncbi:hypothetical protein B375_0211660 (plasmid) [Xylella fastidiosa 6c]|nr:hypothetical protein B375_0211660 [Xylella fastidiosa 6c]
MNLRGSAGASANSFTTPETFSVEYNFNFNFKFSFREAAILIRSGKQANRLLMLRVADERRLPFDVKVPNTTTRNAIAELEAGNGKRFANVDDLMADLHADD